MSGIFSLTGASAAAAAAVLAMILSRSNVLDAGGGGLCPPFGPERHQCAFAESYWEARSMFRNAATAVGAELTELEVVPGYHTDVAVLRGAGPGLVVHSSGVHGVEGFAGSGIQVAFLRKLATDRNTSSDDPTVVMVHAVSPFAMAHYRRFNEHNVDLNRNALPEAARAEVLARDPNVAGYFKLSRLLNPEHAPTLVDAYLRFPILAAYHTVVHGAMRMKRALVAAQYSLPTGIFYGGSELEPSYKLLWAFLERFKDLEQGGRVTWIDVHTGLGRSGEDTLLVADSKVLSVKKLFPGAPKVQAVGGGGDVGGGYDLTRGICEELFRERFSDSADWQFVTQEFGTLPGFLVARAMVLENQAFHYAPEEHAQWATYTRDAFYVRTAAWKVSVLERGVTVLEQAIQRSSQVVRN